MWVVAAQMAQIEICACRNPNRLEAGSVVGNQPASAGLGLGSLGIDPQALRIIHLVSP